MSVPAEKLDMLFKELLEKTNKSSEEFNVISFDEYKKENQNKIDFLNILKGFVAYFNKDNNFFFEVLALLELLYLFCVYSKLQPDFIFAKELEIMDYLNSVEKSVLKIDYLLNEVKKYPNKKLKTTSLKINDKIYSYFKYLKNRTEKIKTEIEEYNFSPPPYMHSAIENIEHIIKKYFEYKDKPRAILSMFNVYYSDPEDLEWTDEDREYVRKHYASKER